jgi:hypothetical protein
MYAFVEPCAGSAVVIFRFDEAEKAIATLQKAGDPSRREGLRM